ncbi:hypothetical protein SFUMM280S_02438 [Streptomyces fumanus]
MMARAPSVRPFFIFRRELAPHRLAGVPLPPPPTCPPASTPAAARRPPPVPAPPVHRPRPSCTSPGPARPRTPAAATGSRVPAVRRAATRSSSTHDTQHYVVRAPPRAPVVERPARELPRGRHGPALTAVEALTLSRCVEQGWSFAIHVTRVTLRGHHQTARAPVRLLRTGPPSERTRPGGEFDRMATTRRNASAMKMVGALLALYREAAGHTHRSSEVFNISEQQIASIDRGRRPLKPGSRPATDQRLETGGVGDCRQPDARGRPGSVVGGGVPGPGARGHRHLLLREPSAAWSASDGGVCEGGVPQPHSGPRRG